MEAFLGQGALLLGVLILMIQFGILVMVILQDTHLFILMQSKT